MLMDPVKTTVKNVRQVKNLMLMLFFLLSANISFAQQKTIKGTVKNSAEGIPVTNASVQVKGTKRGTATDVKGEWMLAAAENETIVISAVGYTSAEIKPGNRTFLNIDLQKNSTDLDGVVVTALGIKREERALGYATSTVKGEELTGALSGNWTDALSGKVAGLNLVRSNSGPAGSTK